MEEMDELFYHDTYCREFEADVISCAKGKNGYEVVLSDTAFYPEGGGQPADVGTLGGVKVVDVKRRNGAVIHITDQPLQPGTSVHGTIDWARRFDHMQQHTGEHIFSGLLCQKYHCDNIGFHMGQETITVDFNTFLDWEGAKEIETRANEIIWKNVPVVVTYPTHEDLQHLQYRSKKELSGKVRIVEIPGADICACCGTHTKTAGEVGLIKVLSVAPSPKGVRIEIVCGARALHAVQKITDQNLEVSHLLSARIFETASAVERLQKELAETKHAHNAMVMNLLQRKAQELGTKPGLVLDFEEGVDAKNLITFTEEVLREGKTETCAALSRDGDSYLYVIRSGTLPLRTLSRELNQKLHGRGGGSDELIQGRFSAKVEEIRTVLSEILKGGEHE